MLKLKELGQHYTELGCETIELILSQMNIRRSSTNPDRDSIVKREVLQEKIDKLLNSPSNLERKEDGRMFIISQNKYLNEGAKAVQLIDNKGKRSEGASAFTFVREIGEKENILLHALAIHRFLK